MVANSSLENSQVNVASEIEEKMSALILIINLNTWVLPIFLNILLNKPSLCIIVTFHWKLIKSSFHQVHVS